MSELHVIRMTMSMVAWIECPGNSESGLAQSPRVRSGHKAAEWKSERSLRPPVNK